MEELLFQKKLQDITTFVLDVDGVFTNNQLIATENGELQRIFNAKDGFALKTAIEKGFIVCIITGGNSIAAYKRFELLGVQFNYFNVQDKIKVLNDFLKINPTNPQNILYIGDDIPDYYAMKMCGLKCCPQDAVAEIKNIADYICKAKGGDTCVREVIEMVLKSQKKWFDL